MKIITGEWDGENIYRNETSAERLLKIIEKRNDEVDEDLYMELKAEKEAEDPLDEFSEELE